MVVRRWAVLTWGPRFWLFIVLSCLHDLDFLRERLLSDACCCADGTDIHF